MSLTVADAQAVFDLLHWIAERTAPPRHPGRPIVDTDRAAAALQHLTDRAGKRMQITVLTEAREAIERLAALLEDGDRARAVCHGIRTHLEHNGSLPWATGAKERT